MIEMRLKTIKINDTGDRQYIGLSEVNGERSLTIVIGYNEVQAIKRGVNEIKPERPLTHDLCNSILAATECKLERVDITELRDGTFYALIRLERPDGGVVEIDARPSDAIALASAQSTPIFVGEEVLKEAATAD
jgi:bifunctional DNase/RNase